jgi:hypothetical protein
VVVGDVLGPPVQGPAHAPGQDLGAEVEHDPGDLPVILDNFCLNGTIAQNKKLY